MSDKLEPPKITRKDWIIDYLKVEFEGQIPKLEALGINTDDQFFEQAINAVIFMAEQQRAELSSLKAENEALKKRVQELQEWHDSHL